MAEEKKNFGKGPGCLRENKPAGIALVFVFAGAAIVLHAVMPSPGATMDTSGFDSFLVGKLGFPAVACGYFLILFLHIYAVIRVFATKSTRGKAGTGCCFGLAFSLLYLGGMQEVMVSASPCTEYGIDFVLYELFLGLGDALPAFFLCLLLCMLYCKTAGGPTGKKLFCRENTVRIVCIAGAFALWRLFGYLTGIVDSEMALYPVPVVCWTFLFGIIAGVSCCLIAGVSGDSTPVLFSTVGLHWVWFNCYIGLIAANTFVPMAARAGADVFSVLIGNMLARKTNRKAR